MPSTFFGLDIAKTGLYMAQSGLNTTAHNIANIETEGYTRQKIVSKAATPMRANGRHGMIGTGVDLVELIQTRDVYYDSKYWKNNSLYGGCSAKENYMMKLQGYLNEIQLEGFTATFDTMYDTIQELEKDPANLTVRTQVTTVAESFCDYFNALSQNLTGIQEDCNFEIKNQVDRVNAFAEEIASLTKQINTIELGGEHANDLRDQRNLLVDQLSAIINVSVDEKAIGGAGMKTYTLKIDGQTLVDTYEANELKVVVRDSQYNQTDANGMYDIVWANGQQFNPYAASQTGSIKALFEIRDGNNADNLQGVTSCQAGAKTVTMTKTNINSQTDLNIPQEGIITVGNREYEYDGFEVEVVDGSYKYTFHLTEEVTATVNNERSKVGVTVDYKGVPYYMAQLNKFIRTFASRFNKLHNQGMDLNGNQGQDFFTGVDKVTGKDYILEEETDKDYKGFNSQTGIYTSDKDSYYMITAENFSVNWDIAHDPSLFAAASDIKDGIGNYDIAKELLALKTDTSMFYQGKPASFLQTLVADVGIDTKSTSDLAKSQKNLVQSIQNQRLSIGGVDSEEEAMNLIQYQQAYKLSSKVISIMNEVYDKLINYMGV